jgi:hypothetical protein
LLKLKNMDQPTAPTPDVQPRPSLRDQIKSAMADPAEDDRAVGLADNTEGYAFQCGTCEYFDDGTCHNNHPKLNGRQVEAKWCCNLYDHDGMQTIVE